MEIVYTLEAQADLAYWRKSGNTGVQQRISALVRDMQEHPFTGIGKPEPLRFNYANYWSRRITQEHRIIYSVNDGIIKVVSLRFHY